MRDSLQRAGKASIVILIAGKFRDTRRVFRKWWRSKQSLDFLYWRVLERRLYRECEELLQKELVRPSFAELSSAVALLCPVSIDEPLARVGSMGDGGYLLPVSATSIDALFSPGVGYEASFEAYFANRGVKCLLVDPTVDQAPLVSSNVKFQKLYLGANSEGNVVGLEDWIASEVEPEKQNLGLQMDIEGGEYSALEFATSKTLSRFAFMIIEFHDLHHLVETSFRARFEGILRKIRFQHEIVHAHANNALPPIRCGSTKLWPLVEIVAVRKDLVTLNSRKPAVPHPLDVKNLAHRRDWPFRCP